MWGAQLAIAVRALAGHKFRSSLTVLSITIGAFAIVLMSSLAESGLDTLKRGIEDLGGARLLLVAPKDPERGEARPATYPHGFSSADRDRLMAGLPHVEEHTMYASLGTRDVVSDEGTTERTDLLAGDSRFLDVFRMRMQRGRAFTADEDREHAKVCVIGHVLARNLWAGDPIGRSLTIAGLRCRVVGVLADNARFGVGFGFDWVNLVVVPGETAGDVDREAREERAIVIKTDAPASNEPVKRILNAILLDRHHGLDDFTLYDFSRIMEKFRTVFAVMEAMVGCIAGIALLIGGVGVMNMMLVSVSERVREIGIRKALGARPADIRRQFVAEALMLSSFGGLAGVASGATVAALASMAIHRFLPAWVSVVSIQAAVAALVVSIGIGLVFGWFPARRAGALDPIQAMRR
jgi:putative ABC transport system permease protein